MPILIQCIGYCPVVVGWYLMLCKKTKKKNHPSSSLERTVARYSVSSEFCPFPLGEIEGIPALYFSSTVGFWRKDANPTIAQGILLTPGLAGMRHQPFDRVAKKSTNLHLWTAKLKPFLVAYPCMPFTACWKCLSVVSRKRSRKQITRSSTKTAVKISRAVWDGSSLIIISKHITVADNSILQNYKI